MATQWETIPQAQMVASLSLRDIRPRHIGFAYSELDGGFHSGISFDNDSRSKSRGALAGAISGAFGGGTVGGRELAGCDERDL